MVHAQRALYPIQRRPHERTNGINTVLRQLRVLARADQDLERDRREGSLRRLLPAHLPQERAVEPERVLQPGVPVREDGEAGREERHVVGVPPRDDELHGGGVDGRVDERAAEGVADGLLEDEHVVLPAHGGLQNAPEKRGSIRGYQE